MPLKDYIQGKKQGKEANRLEREAMNDPFLQEAMDGFDTVSGDHIDVIDRLEKRFSNPVATNGNKRKSYLYLSIAASILLLIGFGTYFFLGRNKQQVTEIAMNQPIVNHFDNKISSSESQAEPEMKLQTEPALAANDIKKNTAVQRDLQVAPIQQDNGTSKKILDVADSDRYVDIADLIEHKVVVEEPKVDKLIKSVAQGKIVDENGAPLIGVSIVEIGTVNGTVTNSSGDFTLQLSKDDSSNLIANYLGYESQEIKLSYQNQRIALKPDNNALSEVLVIGYGVQKKEVATGSVATIPVHFGEKEFENYCRQKADTTVCDGKGATVKVSFFIDETGKPSKIEYKSYSCEDAKKEIENLMSSSPPWTNTNRKVKMTIKW